MHLSLTKPELPAKDGSDCRRGVLALPKAVAHSAVLPNILTRGGRRRSDEVAVALDEVAVAVALIGLHLHSLIAQPKLRAKLQCLLPPRRPLS